MPQPRKVEDNYQGPGVYRHYKGGEYDVMGLALKEDTVPKPDNPDATVFKMVVFVIYKPLTAGSLLESMPTIDLWAREISDFNQWVEVTDKYDGEGGEVVPRFKKVKEMQLDA